MSREKRGGEGVGVEERIAPGLMRLAHGVDGKAVKLVRDRLGQHYACNWHTIDSL
jgi:hypothetical protein